MLRIACPLLLALLLAPSAAAADDFQSRLEKGEIFCYPRKVPGSDVPEMVLKAVVNAPMARVWKIIDACGNYKRTQPRVKDSVEVSRKGQRVVCRVTIDLPFPYSDKTSLTEAVHTVTPERCSRRWKLLSGDYKVNSGSWVLTPFRGDPQRTLVVYRVHAQPDAWVPGWIRKAAQKRSLPEMIRRLRGLSGAKR